MKRRSDLTRLDWLLLFVVLGCVCGYVLWWGFHQPPAPPLHLRPHTHRPGHYSKYARMKCGAVYMTTPLRNFYRPAPRYVRTI